MGHAYAYGQGVKKNSAEALRWFQAACAQGIAAGHAEVFGSKAIILLVAGGKEEESKEQYVLVHDVWCYGTYVSYGANGSYRPYGCYRTGRSQGVDGFICFQLFWAVRS